MNMTKLDDLGFKYSMNGGSWQYEGVTATNVVGTSADMSYTLSITPGSTVNYYAWACVGVGDTIWSPLESYKVPLINTFVTVLGAGSMNGSSWANAFPGTHIQAAISLTTNSPFHGVPNSVNVHVSCNKATLYASSNWGTVFSNIQGITPEPKSISVKIRQSEIYVGYGLNVNTQGAYAGYDANNCNQVVYVTLIVLKTQCP